MMKSNTSIYCFVLFLGTIFFSACNPPTCEKAAPDNMALNSVNDQKIAMDGHDVTAFVIKSKAVKGNPNFHSTHQGIKYYFENEQVKGMFDQNPTKYIPAFGGFCAVAASFGKVEPAQIDLFDFFEGKLYFARNAKAQKMWMEDKTGVRDRANNLWPCLVIDNGRSI